MQRILRKIIMKHFDIDPLVIIRKINRMQDAVTYLIKSQGLTY